MFFLPSHFCSASKYCEGLMLIDFNISVETGELQSGMERK